MVHFSFFDLHTKMHTFTNFYACMSKNDFKIVKQFFDKIKAEKMLLEHFCRPRLYFLSDFLNFFPGDRSWIDANHTKNQPSSPFSGWDIRGGGESAPSMPYTTTKGLVGKGFRKLINKIWVQSVYFKEKAFLWKGYFLKLCFTSTDLSRNDASP